MTRVIVILLSLSTQLLSCSTSGTREVATSEPRASERCPIRSGLLGHPLGSYLTIEGVRQKAGKVGVRTLLVDTVNGRRLNTPTSIWIDNVQELPSDQRCVLRGYETGRMIGLPREVAEAEGLPLPQTVFQFWRYFLVTSVVKPASLKEAFAALQTTSPNRGLYGR
jgi:hypothetical protein